MRYKLNIKKNDPQYLHYRYWGLFFRKRSLNGYMVRAVATGILLSVLKTAEINHLDLHQYLNYLFAALPNLPVPGDLTVLQDYLPWSPKVQEICHE